MEDFTPCLHFVRFVRDEHDQRTARAIAIFGKPDFWHRVWDHRAIRDIAPGDTVVFAKGDEHQRISEFSFDDSQTF